MSGETVRLWADGGEKRRTAADQGERRQPEATYSVAEAAQAAGVPIRTFRDWVTTGKVRHLPPAPPHRGVRIPAAVVEGLCATRAVERQVSAAEGGDSGQDEAANGGSLGRESAEGGERRQPPTPPIGTSLDETATAGDVTRLVAAYEELLQAKETALQREMELRERLAQVEAERQADRIAYEVAQAERDAAASERDFLRSQVDRHATAEAELRVLMLRQSEQLTAFQVTQEQKALPAEAATPKREWWQTPGGPQEPLPWWRFWQR